MERLANATIHSLRGLQYTIAHETAVRQEATMAALAICSASSSHPARLGT